MNSLEVVAEIAGRRYLFADLGHLEGQVAIPINIPSYVKELILVINGEREIKAAPGAVVSLDNGGSRSIMQSKYGTIDWKSGSTLTKPDFAPNMNPGEENSLYRKVKFTGAQLDKVLWNNKKFLTGNKENFDPSKEVRYYGSRYLLKPCEKYAVTVYPLYWQANRYGESDYLVGIYFFKGSGDVAATIEMHDLFMVKDRMTICDVNGNNEQPVNPASPFTQGSLTASDNFASTGYTVYFEDAVDKIYYGFYVKSGLKDSSREEFGRECEHISFQDYRYNSHEWGNDNAWAVNMEYFDESYSGCASAGGAIIPSSSLTHLDPTKGGSLNAKFTPDEKNIFINHGSSYNILGFTAPPTGYDRDLPDFSDCVLMVDTYGENGRRELQSRGEGESLFPWYLAAEDLGGSDDWDFNDLIVTIYDVTTDLTKTYCSANGYYPVPSIFGRRIVVEPVATGATLPVYLMYEGAIANDIDYKHTIADLQVSLNNMQTGTFVVGTEIHKWLGEDDHTSMINVEGDYTDASPRGRAVSFCVPVVKDAQGNAASFDPTQMPVYDGQNNQTMRGFWVLVDKDNSKSELLQNPSFDATPIPPLMVMENGEPSKRIARHNSETIEAFNPFFQAQFGYGMYRVDAPINSDECMAPQMLMCHFNWQWCKERISIDQAYTSFEDWVAGRRTTWHANPNLELGEGLNGYYPDKVCTREEPPTFIQ